jgi:hypothetical protein
MQDSSLADCKATAMDPGAGAKVGTGRQCRNNIIARDRCEAALRCLWFTGGRRPPARVG